MSKLFTPAKIRDFDIKNRFIHSATYECMAGEKGEVKDELIKRYETLAKGEIGLIIPGFLFVHPLGKAMKYQAGVHTDDMIPGLERIVEMVHGEGAKIAFQLVHGGGQSPKSLIGQKPFGPSDKVRDPVTLNKPKMMSEAEIQEVIDAFVNGAKRAAKAGADAVQFHGAHGFLISEFLSPFYNRRQDGWGGSDENRFRFIKEIFLKTRSAIPDETAVLIKLNTNDFTPKKGITPELAKKYAQWLVELGIDGIELSCGTYHTFHVVRGEIPSKEMAMGLPRWMRPLAKLNFKKLAPKCSFKEGYNLEAAKEIKPVMGDIPLILVGGVRNLSYMEEVIQAGTADFISMSRPFVREPFLVKKFREGKTDKASCVSCNKCFAAIFNNFPLRCYNTGLPTS